MPERLAALFMDLADQQRDDWERTAVAVLGKEGAARANLEIAAAPVPSLGPPRKKPTFRERLTRPQTPVPLTQLPTKAPEPVADWEAPIHKVLENGGKYGIRHQVRAALLSETMLAASMAETLRMLDGTPQRSAAVDAVTQRVASDRMVAYRTTFVEQFFPGFMVAFRQQATTTPLFENKELLDVPASEKHLSSVKARLFWDKALILVHVVEAWKQNPLVALEAFKAHTARVPDSPTCDALGVAFDELRIAALDCLNDFEKALQIDFGSSAGQHYQPKFSSSRISNEDFDRAVARVLIRDVSDAPTMNTVSFGLYILKRGAVVSTAIAQEVLDGVPADDLGQSVARDTTLDRGLSNEIDKLTRGLEPPGLV